MTATATKTKPPKLGKAAAAVLAHLHQTGDSIGGSIENDRHYWAFTRSGLPVRGADVRALRAARLIKHFGAEIDPDGPAACYVPAVDGAATQCGAASLQACEGPGLCLDCAPAAMIKRIRAGKEDLPKVWKGARP